MADALAADSRGSMCQSPLRIPRIRVRPMLRLLICGRREGFPAAARADVVGMQVAGRTLQLGLGLGLILAAVLALGKGGLPRLFTGDAAVLAAIGHIFPWVILSQPINALAFVWDGILYGAGGFSYAAKVGPPPSCFVCNFTGDLVHHDSTREAAGAALNRSQVHVMWQLLLHSDTGWSVPSACVARQLLHPRQGRKTRACSPC